MVSEICPYDIYVSPTCISYMWTFLIISTRLLGVKSYASLYPRQYSALNFISVQLTFIYLVEYTFFK